MQIIKIKRVIISFCPLISDGAIDIECQTPKRVTELRKEFEMFFSLPVFKINKLLHNNK